MKNVSVQQLRSAGYKVCVIHSRYFYGELTKLSEIQARIDLANEEHGFDAMGRPTFDWCHENHISPGGGETEVIITTPAGLSYSHTARVKEAVAFSYRVGRNVAIGRCFADIQEDTIPKVEVKIAYPNQAEIRGFVAREAFITNAYIEHDEQRVHCYLDPNAKVEILDKVFSDECLDQGYFSRPSSTRSFRLHGQGVIGMPPSHYGFSLKAKEGVTPTPAVVAA